MYLFSTHPHPNPPPQMNVWHHLSAHLPLLKRYVQPRVQTNAENTKRLLVFNAHTRSLYLLIEYEPTHPIEHHVRCLFSLYTNDTLVEAHEGNLLDIHTYKKIDAILSQYFTQSAI